MKSLFFGIAAMWVAALPLRAAFAEGSPSKTLPLAERVTIATQLYSAISTYYPHWKAVPGFDLDKEYAAYLDKILGDPDRRDFALASQEFVARLENGHSTFVDQYMNEADGKSFGFYAMPLQGKWTVITSRIDAVRPGDVLSTIDGRDFGEFYRSQRKFISGSDEPDRASHFFYRRYLFPQTFTLGLGDGRKVAVKRLADDDQDDALAVREEDGILYIQIPGFDEPKFEDGAVEAIKAHLDAKTIIIDVRGNGGGQTPQKLISILMDRQYQEWSEMTSVRMGVLEVYQDIGTHPALQWSAPYQMPTETHYKGQLLILTDVRCFSACTDFVEPFKVNHRATIVGSPTGASTGEPYIKRLGDGFLFSVSAKRDYFPDGSEFEGVGIMPDVAIELTPADLKAGNDPVLAKAKSLIK